MAMLQGTKVGSKWGNNVGTSSSIKSNGSNFWSIDFKKSIKLDMGKGPTEVAEYSIYLYEAQSLLQF